MSRHLSFLAVASGLALLAAVGCRPQQPFYFSQTGDLGHYVGVATDIEYPDTQTDSLDEVEHASPPWTPDEAKPTENPGDLAKPRETWDLGLDQALQIALENGTIIRNLGGVAFGPTGAQGTPGALLQSPATAATTFIPALTETNARTGVEAALAAFDAQFSMDVSWEKNDTPQNVAGFVEQFRPKVFQQDLGTFQAQISKIAATGTQWTIRHNINYEMNNIPASPNPLATREFPAEWDANIEAEFRHPFLQGAGVGFNRIAGPGAVPGFNTGVLIARVQVDQSLADFEGAVRAFVADVERAYWNLYYAYHRLDAAIEGRNRTYDFWQTIYAIYKAGAKGKLPQNPGTLEASARGQYYQFEAAVQQAKANLYKTEAALRYMMGLAANDGRLIYPTTKPATAWVPAFVHFDWADAYAEGLVRSVELRKQRWRIKQAEMELMAAKNWLLPRLDAVGRYRWKGIGQELLHPDRTTNALGEPIDAYGSMTSGRFQDWHLELQLRFPFGFRREMAGVRFAQLTLTRERKILQEQELELQHQLADAFRELWVQYKTIQENYNRFAAAEAEVNIWEAQLKGQIESQASQFVLDAYRRKADAEDAYHRSLADYNLAIMQLHFRKGSLLEYDGVYLAEGPWPAKAYFDARRRARARDAAHYINYGFTQPKVVSQGPYQQMAGEAGLPLEGQELLPLGPPEDQGPLTPTPAEQDGSKPPEEVPTPRPIPADRSPAGATPAQKSQHAPPPDQTSAAGPAGTLARSGQPDQNTEAPAKGYDLGSLDLGALAGKAEGAAPAAAGQPTAVQPASYQQAAAAKPAETWKAPSSGRTIGNHSGATHEPVASASSAATDQSAPGWKAAQH
jgi:outer membrane protein TolC